MKIRTFFPSNRASLFAGLAVAALLAGMPLLRAQDAAPTQTTPPVAANTPEQSSTGVTLTKEPKAKKLPKSERVQQTKDTRAEVKKENKYNPLVGKDAQLPDKQLYDKSLAQEKSGHYDVARLDLQTLLNTYPDSKYQMLSKLAIADCWYREGGTAALTQAEQEYKDFITFFPNAPEAAEAQMRVGDIYFKQMDVPDRDYTKAVHAQEEYRTMLKQYPDAPPTILKEARQKLREVQEMLATREAELAAFYSLHQNWPATIARYQTVVDTYPQYSHMDDALIGMGDAYEAEATLIRSQKMPEGPKAKLEQEFDGKAADAYRKVVLEHAASPHVEDAKERLIGMNLAVPTPTKEQVAASEALESSRAQYTMTKRLELLVLRRPDTVTAAQMGDPPLEDPPATTAPTILRGIQASYGAAFGTPAKAVAGPNEPAAPADSAPASVATPVSNAPLSLSDVPAPGQGSGDGSTSTMTPATASAPGRSVGNPGASLGVEVLTPGTGASSLPAATGAQDPNNGLNTAAPKDMSALPAVEKPADAPDAVNDASGKPQPGAQTVKPGDKTPKPAYDKNDESSSKKKPKQGVDKLNPF